ncbi:MAG: TetR/AcrR family transcriptional regulator [Desulfovibrionaceae bacterium]|nr:TetR/AcrR family transcriptional regulator [Desulfovibrionaceae bacterium]MBF0513988.1 TetR/AcrR family transcriptional regulator [Desulfovibrionaceae bacterium]
MGRKKTPESDALATREKIVETAARLFRGIGYAKTTIADIAGSLGMSPSNVYRYFPTKAHINEEICGRLVRDIELRCVDSIGKDGAAFKKVTSFVLEYHRSIKESILKENRLYDMVSIAMEQHWPVIQGHSERIRGILAELMESGVSSGEFKDMDRYKMARAIHESIAIFIYPPLLERWVNEFAGAAPEDGVEGQLEFLLGVIFHGVCLRNGQQYKDITG